MGSLREQIGKVTEATFPKGKSFYVDYFIDLIVENAPEYEYFELYLLIDSLNLENDMQERFNSLSIFINKKLLDIEVVGRGQFHELILTELGIEIKKSEKKLSEFMKQKKENSTKNHNNVNVYGHVENLIQDSTAKNFGNKHINPKKNWWEKISNNSLIVGIIILILTSIFSYFGIKN